MPRLELSRAALTILGCLLVVESVATLISNASLAAEVSKREEITRKATLSTVGGDKSPNCVPLIWTQVAELTYIQNPKHDSIFLGNWRNAIEHDVRTGGPLPNLVNPLNVIKSHYKD